jgi:hypothetical protein
MEDKRGIKQEFSPSEEGSPTPSDAKTPSPMSAGSPPPPGSPSEVSSDHPHSPVFEQGGPSRIALVIKIPSSSNEEDFFADVTWDAKFAKWLFGDFHHDLLRLPGDGKVIIISDSDEEKDAREEATTEAKATPSTTNGKASTPAATPADADEDPSSMPHVSSDGLALGQDTCKSSGGGDEAHAP